ncbi:hypothetical protein MUN78_03355 [Leucobacter allii]|uniref:Uncharacterized protein n=1 Tax=Leucobacter allii TaxID=2932247 RepID=A0ABY4FNN4_9MICO|nr:hypothetical protein [Leucobacter allii]UOQ57888.1 hypothetical protein MUN78_03355 [Leucobacter allii]
MGGARGRNGRAGGWIWMLLAFLPLAAGLALTFRQMLPATVSSAAELARVGFGWPFAWTVQDHRGIASPAEYPAALRYLGERRGAAVSAPTTEVHWGLFALDTVLLWAAVAALLLAGIAVTRRVLRSRRPRAR